MQVVQLTETDNGSSVQLTKNDRLLIKLFANPTTGYDWEMQPNKHFSVSKQFSAAGEQKTGSGGTTVFELTPQAPGKKGTLVFRYKRSWEQSSEEEKKFSIKYQVQ